MKYIKMAAAVFLAAVMAMGAAGSAFAYNVEWKTGEGIVGWNDDGSRITNDWVQLYGIWYYLGEDGVAVKNRWVGDYYLADDGSLMYSTVTPDGWTVDENGKWVASVPNVFDGSYCKDISAYGGVTVFTGELQERGPAFYEAYADFRTEDEEGMPFEKLVTSQVVRFRKDCVVRHAEYYDPEDFSTRYEALTPLSAMDAQRYRIFSWVQDAEGYITEFTIDNHVS